MKCVFLQPVFINIWFYPNSTTHYFENRRDCFALTKNHIAVELLKVEIIILLF